eukprot:EC783246.1.p1 GENE.EC783246.1~~EC783246.1.p1  ORF type:complete len:59 (+),score=12.84 EC783246.1:58-234(+)
MGGGHHESSSSSSHEKKAAKKDVMDADRALLDLMLMRDIAGGVSEEAHLRRATTNEAS